MCAMGKADIESQFPRVMPEDLGDLAQLGAEFAETATMFGQMMSPDFGKENPVLAQFAGTFGKLTTEDMSYMASRVRVGGEVVCVLGAVDLGVRLDFAERKGELDALADEVAAIIELRASTASPQAASPAEAAAPAPAAPQPQPQPAAGPSVPEPRGLPPSGSDARSVSHAEQQPLPDLRPEPAAGPLAARQVRQASKRSLDSTATCGDDPVAGLLALMRRQISLYTTEARSSFLQGLEQITERQLESFAASARAKGRDFVLDPEALDEAQRSLDFDHLDTLELLSEASDRVMSSFQRLAAMQSAQLQELKSLSRLPEGRHG